MGNLLGYLNTGTQDQTNNIINDINLFYGFPNNGTLTYCKPVLGQINGVSLFFIPVDSDFLDYFYQDVNFSFDLLECPDYFIVDAVTNLFIYEAY